MSCLPGSLGVALVDSVLNCIAGGAASQDVFSEVYAAGQCRLTCFRSSVEQR